MSFWWAKRRRIFDEHPSTSIQWISWIGWISELVKLKLVLIPPSSLSPSLQYSISICVILMSEAKKNLRRTSSIQHPVNWFISWLVDWFIGWIIRLISGSHNPIVSFWGACSIPVRFNAADWAPKNLRWPVRNLQPDSSSLRLSTTRWVLDWGKWLN
jgi:hypothetical protein